EPGVDAHDTLGYNFKFTDVQAVIGLEQFKKVPQRAQRKRDLFRQYRDELANVSEIQFLQTDLSAVAPWFMDIQVDAEHRDALAHFLKERGIGTRPFYPPIHSQ